MSSGGGLAAAVEGGIEGGTVLPAAPDDPQPGAGQDPDGVRMPAATPGRGGVDAGGPGVGHPAAVGEVHHGGAEFLAAGPAEYGLAALAGLAGRRAGPGERGQRVVGGEPLPAVPISASRLAARMVPERGRLEKMCRSGCAASTLPISASSTVICALRALSMATSARVICPRASPSG